MAAAATCAAAPRQLPMTPWFDGRLFPAEGILVGVVQEVSSELKRSVSEIVLEESCTLKVESLMGAAQDMSGEGSVRLTAKHTRDPYQQPEDDWGLLSHLTRGQRVVVWLHRYEGLLVFGSSALVALNEQTQALPEILRRTRSQASRLSRADLRVFKAASPLLHAQALDAAGMTSLEEAEGTSADALVGVCVATVLGLVWLCDFLRRR
ncbi:hypothetical protein [Prosthecobacter vanneervenii]|uniref:Uncharacterized protein n=1 Tax=Prosthecobacter vanneervenii TaxID=48466 RepID=A0A7W8DMH5_9BACT|nr:hypothetical protein [Prosthecobacter vanneervenii]MBB5034956.1 hypothetical protein [Prosthecobacter vanneervenii]